MPDLFFADLVRETSTATGNGALVLGGATPGHRRFADAVPDGARFHYAIAGVTHENQWEIGEGELLAGALVRHRILASPTDAAIDFAAGLKTVTLTVAADWFAGRDDRSGHAHAIGQIGGLAEALASKQPVGSYAAQAHSHDYLPRDASGNWVASNASLGVGSSARFAQLEVRGASIAGYSLQFGGALHSRAGMQLYLGDANFYHQEFWRSAPGIGAVVDPSGVAGALGLAAYGGQLGSNSLIALASFSGYAMRGFSPAVDNMVLLGRPELRWSDIHAANGAIITSDDREKQWLGSMDQAEYQAALAIIAELGFFQWHASIDAKGPDAARRHFGVRAQRAFAIMEDHGLDWRSYGWCCQDRWQERSEAGEDEGEDDGESALELERERYGIRSDQLCLFLIAALSQRLALSSEGAEDAAG